MTQFYCSHQRFKKKKLSMKPFLLLSLVFCCWGYAMAFSEITVNQSQEPTTIVLTDEPTPATNGSSPWVPQKSFFSGAFSAFTVIAISELGDKTFFIAVVLSLTCSPLCVFLGALSALALMTMLSAGLGLVSTVIPNFWVQCVSAALFIIFGIKMFREAYLMKSTAGKDELEDVQKTLDTKMAIVDTEAGGKKRLAVRWVFLEAFAMTFLAEWGDRSQITTLLLAAKENIYGVIMGATLGHAACTLLAVLGGRIVSDRISLRVVTYFGAVLFFVFAILSIVNAVQEYLDPTTS